MLTKVGQGPGPALHEKQAVPHTASGTGALPSHPPRILARRSQHSGPELSQRGGLRRA